ncbi:MAG: hypothetical protein KAG61_03640 [Bacteriovoracaceae bacterium]|nr:hypothetical protein [Bacteriovoracaceae bacterium]
MKIRFFTRKEYNSVVFEAGCVYDLPEEHGFAKRWIKRGCKHVVDFDGKLSSNELSIGSNGDVVVEEIAVEEIAVEEIAVEEIAVEEIAVEEIAVEETADIEVAKEEKTVETVKKKVRPSRAKKK